MYFSPNHMHIPDGYLSPATSLVMFLLVLPFWYLGAQALRKRMSARNMPYVALMAAFSFIIMMFNIPLPGGTSGHATGAALAAILLGPQIAGIAVSIALVIQALFFGDGGILQIGANCFTMGVVIPYVSYFIYQLISRNASITAKRRLVGAAVGGWVGLTLSALITAILFGVQPLLYTAADGTPLYAPYALNVAIPAMLIPHMLVASVIEGAVTALIVAYLQRTNPSVLEMSAQPQRAVEPQGARRLRWLWLGLAALVVLTPLGLLAPGTAWGEWGASELTDLGLNFVPQGLARLEGLWGAPMADYQVSFLGNASLGYVLSAVLGIALVSIVAWLFGKLLTRNRVTTETGK